MKSVKLSIVAFSLVSAFAAQAQNLGQNGISNAGNVQAPPPANQGPTEYNGNGQGQQQANANTVTATGKAKAKAKAKAQSSGNSVVVGADGRRIPVATAYAAGLAASNGTCLGSASGGVQFVPFGISGASTKEDKGCNLRYNAEMLRSLGMEDAAVAVMCEDEYVRRAMTATGRSCEQGGAKVGRVPGAPVAAVPLPATPSPVQPTSFVPVSETSSQFVPVPVQREPREDRGALGEGGDVSA